MVCIRNIPLGAPAFENLVPCSSWHCLRKVVEPLTGGALLKKVYGVGWGPRVQNLALLPVHTLLCVCCWRWDHSASWSSNMLRCLLCPYEPSLWNHKPKNTLFTNCSWSWCFITITKINTYIWISSLSNVFTVLLLGGDLMIKAPLRRKHLVGR